MYIDSRYIHSHAHAQYTQRSDKEKLYGLDTYSTHRCVGVDCPSRVTLNSPSTSWVAWCFAFFFGIFFSFWGFLFFSLDRLLAHLLILESVQEEVSSLTPVTLEITLASADASSKSRWDASSCLKDKNLNCIGSSNLRTDRGAGGIWTRPLAIKLPRLSKSWCICTVASTGQRPPEIAEKTEWDLQRRQQ